MASMPANVSYGAVTGRFMRAVADGPDADRTPDGLPLVGMKVTFTPSVRTFKNLSDMVTFFADPISGTTNEDGLLVDSQGGEAVYLLATDDPDLLPSGWTWSVSISSPSIPTLAFNFALPSNGSIDLTSVIPVSANPGSIPPPVSSVAGLHGDVMAPDLALALEPFMTGGGGGGAVSSVNGKVGAVTLTATDVGALPGTTVIPTTPADIGLGNVNNTADASKPISTATQAALDGKKAANWVPGVADLPAGATITVFGNVARPTARTDITVQWVHTSQPTAFNAACDVWLNI